MSSADHPSRRRQQHQRRPLTIAELSEKALDNLYDETKPLKHFLRVAERYRKDARDYYSKGDLENAFICFARAATLVLDKLPTHREYYTLLMPNQRSNLNLNGSDILEELGSLKRKLAKRYEDWVRDHPEGEQPEPSASTSTQERRGDIDMNLRATRSKGKERERARGDHHRRMQDDYAHWRHDDYDHDDIDELAERERRRHRDQGNNRDRGVFVTPQQQQQQPPHSRQPKKEAVVTAAWQAASVPQTNQVPDYTFSRQPLRSQNGQQSRIPSGSDGPDMNDEGKRYAEMERQYQYEQQQKEMRHREEEITRRREESRRRKEEEEGIFRRQKEAEAAAHAARSEARAAADRRPSHLSAQGSIASMASGSSAASLAPSTLFPHQSGTSSTATTPSSFYQNPVATSSTMMPPPSSSPYHAHPMQQKVSPSSSPSYPPGPSKTSPSGSYQYAPGSSSTQVVIAPPPSSHAPGSSSTQVVMQSSAAPYYSQSSPSSQTSSQATASQPSYQHPGSASTTVVFTKSSPNPLPIPPRIAHGPPPLRQEQHVQAQPPHPGGGAGRPPSFAEGPSQPTMLPIEPSRFEADSTDSESVTSYNPRLDERQRPYPSRFGDRYDENRTPTRRKSRSPSPFTTTSPPPGEVGRAVDLMSQHQKSQGYHPSSNSIFSAVNAPIRYPSQPYPTGNGAAPLYGSASEILHNRHSRNSGSTSYPYQSAQRPPPASMQTGPPYQFRPGYPGQPQGAMPVPLPTPPPFSSIPRSIPVIPPSSSRSMPNHNPYLRESGTLKSVTLPKDSLSKFLAIASLNTAMNRETCGLLLGKDKGNKYAVTTLLIPKQRSTSDTCTMDEEELVLQFTEERCLITLGWIHTHPSQSCFMSSVDLHTHSGFQRMLPESFAVVCAPKSKPDFGIFRLTDPPGLKAILDCKATDAFHPHPDLPIYTDADRGHVQMKEGKLLEIVDLR